ncbi:endonuclease/exonuclease/phosphatase family protein [Nonomuraea dietziae]|uniref:endonuclease/exonuclease/phosphatase family protein n=1 Tax=Nonomuraea dietziae TaxID=65515 RepID=UPI003CD0B0EB
MGRRAADEPAGQAGRLAPAGQARLPDGRPGPDGGDRGRRKRGGHRQHPPAVSSGAGSRGGRARARPVPRADGVPWCWAGDLNTRPGDPEMRVLESAGLSDPLIALGNPATSPADAPVERIDHVLVTGGGAGGIGGRGRACRARIICP